MALIRNSTQAYSASATSLSVNVPSGTVDGDVLAVFLLHDNSNSLTPVESGWTATQANTGSQMTLGVYTRTVSGTPPASYGWTFGAAAANFMGVAVTINPNGDTLDAITVATIASTLANATATTNAVTGVTDPSILLGFFGADDTVTVSSGPSGMGTELQFVDGNAMDAVCYGQVNPGTGSLTKSITWSASTDTLATIVLFDFTAVLGPTITNPARLSSGTNGSPLRLVTQQGVGSPIVIR